MNHLLEISQLSKQDILKLIHRAIELKKTEQFPTYPSLVMVNLFYEHSTRTRVSFDLAGQYLGMKVINIELKASSETKGELIEDTIRTLAAMGIKYFIIRHKHEGLPQQLADKIKDIHIINAGDGTHAHPSQALLDMMTIMEKKSAVEHLKIALVGNIKHSRVAQSFQCISQKLGVKKLALIAPPIWQPNAVHYGELTSDLKEGLANADVVICLRVQRERLLAEEHIDLEQYREGYALTLRTQAYAKPDAMVMHPGPINRGIEIDSEVADGPQSFILQQITNGVYTRMAILEALIGKQA